jgi:type I restriction enzyme S subunit
MAKKKAEKSLDELLEEALVKEDEQPYEVPGNWEWTRPTSLAEQLRGVTYKKKDAVGQPEEGKSLILRAGNLQEGEFITDHDCVYVANDLISNIQQLTVGDVVVVGSSGSKSIVGKAAQVKKVMPSTSFGAFLTLFRPNNLINSKYYGWFFQSKYYRDTISMLSAGININNIKREHFESLHFPLPPLPEQKRIVKKLSSMLGKLKEAKDLIQEARDTFEERRAAILNKAFTGELTKKWREENPDVEISLKEIEERKKKPYQIPAKWKWVNLKEIGEIVTGTTPSKKRSDFYGDKFPLFKPTDLNEGYYVTQAADNLSESGIRATRVLPERSVMVTCIGATIGKTGFSRIKGATNQQINSIIADEKVLPEYIYFTAISPFFQRSILNNASATTLPILNKTRFGNLLFPLSPLPEQKEIVRILEKLLDHEEEARTLIDMEEQIDLLEKSILSKAFRGELGTNDPDEEPAIELLKRSLKEKMNK